MPSIKFKGFTIEKSDFEAKYKVSLSDLEWKLICERATENWQEFLPALRNIALKSIKPAMNSIGYNAKLDGFDVIFEKKDS